MKIISFDKRRGMELIPEDIEDLWVLYNIIHPGDIVSGRTTREVRSKDEGQRPNSGKRVPIDVTICVDKIDFQQDNERLRIGGYIVEGPEKYGLVGSHHTINLTINKRIKLTKDEWGENELERVRIATEERYEPIIVVALDDEEAAIVTLRQHGINVIGEVQTSLPGKLEIERRSEALSKYFSAILKFLDKAWKQEECSIVIVGPGLWKELFARFIADHSKVLHGNISAIANASSGGVRGVEEALRSGVLGKLIEKNRVAMETKAVEEVLLRIGTQGKVTYGLENVKKAALQGGVDRVLISDRLLRDASPEERKIIESLMKDIEKMKGGVLIVHVEHEAGHKLWNLGGIAALLRFQLE
jgi:protein pelota